MKIFKELKLLLNNVPSLIVSLFIISVVGMNILANKSINTNLEWLALDCGILFSWLSFLSMDILTKRYGPRAATMISLVALGVNLIVALVFFLASVIPGLWSASFVEGSEDIINGAFDETFRGTWYILLGSSVAFIASAIVNNFLNYGIGKLFKNQNSFLTFAARSYGSTMIAQFVDNLIFALLVSKIFFGWTFLQCIMCSLFGALLELLFEIVFSPIGYKVCKKLEKEKVGEPYLQFMGEKNEIDN